MPQFLAGHAGGGRGHRDSGNRYAVLGAGSRAGLEEHVGVNWINNVVRPKTCSLLANKREVPENLLRVKCPDTGQMVFYKDLEANQFVIPGSNFMCAWMPTAPPSTCSTMANLDKVAVREVVQTRPSSATASAIATASGPPRTTPSWEDAVLVGEGQLEGQDGSPPPRTSASWPACSAMAAGEAVITGNAACAVEKRTPFILLRPRARACRKASSL